MQSFDSPTLYEIIYTKKMKHDVKMLQRQGKDLTKLANVLLLLANKKRLPKEYSDHALIGNMKGFRECHIESDWLLLYSIDSDKLVLYAVGTGSHSYLFKK